MARALLEETETAAPRDVPDTGFGIWFQGTEIWRHYVLRDTLAALDRVLARPGARFPRILDAGCGQGLALPFLRERYRPARLIGIDSDPALIAKAERERLPDCELRTGDVTRLDLSDGSVDLALCHQTLHHVRDQRRALAELLRVLAPGGVLLLAESCAPFIRLWWVRLFFRHVREAQHTADEYVALVRAAGFAVPPAAVATPDPWWSLGDLGLRERWLGQSPARREHTLVCLAGVKPA